jgi:SHAQKYF class myb-like DNA-binding protein
MAYDMMNGTSAVVSNMRSEYDLPNSNTAVPYSYKSAYSFPGRGTHSSLSIAEQAELEYELRYRGNMIVDQQRKIQQLEEELRQARDQVDMMNNQLSTYEQDRVKEKKKPQSRYWTPEEHQRFLEALQKYGHKDVKSISMHVSTRNATQVRTHAQKYFLRLERERRKKEDNTGGESYDSSGSFEDDGSPGDCDETISSQVASVSISSLTLPGSPAVMSDSIGTPPGTPGHESPGPGTPNQSGSQSPVPTSSPVPIRRRRATSFISVAQARLAAQHRDSVLVGLPPTWTVEDYDCFMKGLLSMADKQDDVQTLCRLIREQYLPHHTPDEVELCYRNVLRDIKHKPLAGSPKRRRTNSRPEPLSSSLGLAAHLSPSFPVPPVSTLASSFPFRNSVHSPTSTNSPNQGYSSSPSSPLAHSQSMHSPNNMRSPFSEYGQLPNGMEFPLLGELNLNGVPMNHSPANNINSMNHMGQMNPNTMPPNSGPNNMQAQMQGLSILPNSPQNLNSNPITPSSLWGGNALPFSFDALMSGNVGLSQAMPLVSPN